MIHGGCDRSSRTDNLRLPIFNGRKYQLQGDPVDLRSLSIPSQFPIRNRVAKSTKQKKIRSDQKEILHNLQLFDCDKSSTGSTYSSLPKADKYCIGDSIILKVLINLLGKEQAQRQSTRERSRI